jgi:phosphoserine phosphatase RsbU/P
MASHNLQPLSDTQRKLEILLGISETLGKEIHLNQIFAVVVPELSRAMDAERSSLFLYDQATGELYTKVAQGLQTAEIRVPSGAGIVGSAAKSGQSINIRDAYQDSRFNPEFDKKSGFVTKSILSTPIVSQSQRLLGVVQVLNKVNGEAFTADDEAFLRAICTHLALTIERAELVKSYVQAQTMQQSLQLAREIQMGLLPKRFPAFPDHLEVDVHAAIKPAQDVGGDLYDFFLLDQDHLCFVIGDVSDKGIPAALFMAMVRTAFKISAMANPDSIANTFRTVNRFLFESNESQMFVTLFGGILDLRTGEIQYCDGGHEPPFLLCCTRGVEMMEKVGGVALGFLPDFAFKSGSIQMEEGDYLVLYTDGVNEAMNVDSQMFETSRIQHTLEAFGNESTAEAVANSLMCNVTEFAGTAPQSDDITLLVLQYRGPASSRQESGA